MIKKKIFVIATVDMDFPICDALPPTLTSVLLVGTIMAKNEPSIYTADKSITFCRDVRFGIIFQKKNMTPRENPPYSHFVAIKMGRNISNISNFSLSGPIYTKFGMMT